MRIITRFWSLNRCRSPVKPRKLQPLEPRLAGPTQLSPVSPSLPAVPMLQTPLRGAPGRRSAARSGRMPMPRWPAPPPTGRSSSCCCCTAASVRCRPIAPAAPTAVARRSWASRSTSTAAGDRGPSASCAAPCREEQPQVERRRPPHRARPDRAAARTRRLTGSGPPCPRPGGIQWTRFGPGERLDRHLRPARAGLRLPAGHRQPPRVHRPLPGRLAPHEDRLGRAAAPARASA